MALIEVVMAIYRPNMAALERQVASVLAQQGCRVRLHLFADGPMPELADVARLAQRDDRICLTAFPQNRGAAATFCEGLAAVAAMPGEGRCFAFCDQDDVWHTDKLARSLARLSAQGADGVHGDVRVVDAAGTVIAPSAFALEGRVPTGDPAALFFRNNATGMTMLLGEALARRVARALRSSRNRLPIMCSMAAMRWVRGGDCGAGRWATCFVQTGQRQGCALTRGSFCPRCWPIRG
jgi:glycosyltransferase involved in cell wall biosynthesis